MQLERDLPVYDSVLLLQGPVGPFFAKFGRWLRSRGSDVFKVNFNLGDDVFYRDGAFRFTDPMQDFSEYLQRLVMITGAKAIFVFGEMRPMHKIAIKLAASMGVEVWAFEEGFVRPGYLTLENVTHRVREMHYVIHSTEQPEADEPIASRWVFYKMALKAFCYFTATMLGFWRYPHYQHHKPATVAEGARWVLALYRRVAYRFVDWFRERRVLNGLRKNFFLVPLQVHNDYAVSARSDVDSIEQFIERVLVSFAEHGPNWKHLVFKHHPLDRGHRQYSSLIRRVSKRLGIQGRVHYLHDSNGPELMKASLGVVLINSTMGLQALHHQIPVLMVGRAFYESMAKRGWGQLRYFWLNGRAAQASMRDGFKLRLIRATQVPGSFYDTSWVDRMIPDYEGGALRRQANRVKLDQNTTILKKYDQHNAQRGVDSRASS